MKPRLAARVDTVQPQIIADLRQLGARVLVLDVSAEGEPDILVAWLGKLTLMELKSKDGKLTERQKEVHEEYRRHGVRVATVRTRPEAFAAIGMDPATIAQRKQEMRGLGEALAPGRREARVRQGAQPAVRRYGT